MTQLDEERTYEQDRIAETVNRAIVEMVLNEDPEFYECDATQPSKVTAAVMIAGLKRSSDGDLVVEAVCHSACRLERARLWKAVEEMAIKAQADFQEQAPDLKFNGRPLDS
jgi:hypothetical protein